jgi:ribosomal protein S8
MKTNKAQGVLYILEVLQTYGYVEKWQIMSALSITELTFRRYICEIRCYFMNFEKREEILYERRTGRYIYKRL